MAKLQISSTDKSIAPCAVIGRLILSADKIWSFAITFNHQRNFKILSPSKWWFNFHALAGIRSRAMLEELLRLKCEVWFWSLSQREKLTYISYLHLHSAWSKVFANASYFICCVRPLQSFKFYIYLDVNLNIKYYLCISHNIQSCFKYWKPWCVTTRPCHACLLTWCLVTTNMASNLDSSRKNSTSPISWCEYLRGVRWAVVG